MELVEKSFIFSLLESCCCWGKVLQRSPRVVSPSRGSDNLDDLVPLPPNTYLVERIEAEKMKKGKKFYYIKWKGYRDEENTWEPEENIQHCTGLLEQFRLRQEQAVAGVSGSAPPSTIPPCDPSTDPVPPPLAIEWNPTAQQRPSVIQPNPFAVSNLTNPGNLAMNGIFPPAAPTPEVPEKSEEEEEETDVEGAGNSEPSGKILSLFRNGDQRIFVIRWDGVLSPKNIEHVIAEEAKERFPQMVIQYYENLFLRNMRRPLRQ